MTVALNDVVRLCDDLLQPDRFRDYCPNGLQVEGRHDVGLIVSGVTASQALIDRAVDVGADALLVHHGYFWRGENPSITGMKFRRIRALIEHGISLIAYHLPLDAHPEYGNNVQLARRLGIQVTGVLQPGDATVVGNVGRLPRALDLAVLADHIAVVLQRQPQFIAGGDHPVDTIGWCTGSADNYIVHAAELGLSAFLSGEISEPTVHIARELGIHYIAAGHHATERYGVQALGDYAARQLGVTHRFIDADNPV